MTVITTLNTATTPCLRPARGPDALSGHSPAFYAISVSTAATYRCAIVMRTYRYHSHLR